MIGHLSRCGRAGRILGNGAQNGSRLFVGEFLCLKGTAFVNNGVLGRVGQGRDDVIVCATLRSSTGKSRGRFRALRMARAVPAERGDGVDGARGREWRRADDQVCGRHGGGSVYKCRLQNRKRVSGLCGQDSRMNRAPRRKLPRGLR